jgi:hypothetical protein
MAYLGLEVPEDEDLDQVLPAGDLSIFTDLGLDEMDLGMIAGNLDLFPDEALAIIARKLGFGQAYERALTLALGRVPSSPAKALLRAIRSCPGRRIAGNLAPWPPGMRRPSSPRCVKRSPWRPVPGWPAWTCPSGR